MYKVSKEGKLLTKHLIQEINVSEKQKPFRGFPEEESPAHAGDPGSIPGLGRSHMPQSN